MVRELFIREKILTNLNERYYCVGNGYIVCPVVSVVLVDYPIDFLAVSS